MTVGSVFSGIGGFDLGLERAGLRVMWQIEREPFCQKVLRRHWPDVPCHDDVLTATADTLSSVDALVGGFPCQDLSVAGKRAGLNGSRSSLFYEFLRLASELQPEWLVIENVPGLLTSHGGRDFHALLSALAERGWRRAYRILDSQHFGVAQRRRRVFIVGHRGTDGSGPEAVLFEPESRPRDSQTGRTQRARLATDVAASLRFGGEGARGFNLDAECGLIAGPLGGGNDGIGRCSEDDPNLVVGETARALVGSMHKRHDDDTDTLLVSRPLKAGGNDRQDESHQAYLVASTLTQEWDRGPRGDGRDNLIAATLNAGGNSGGFRTEPGDHQQGIAFTLRSDPGGIGQGHNTTYPDGVRRLTPLECERLQGFPDGWTCLCGVTPYTTADCQCADSARYRALGNAVTVNVAEWIGTRLSRLRRGR